MFDIKNSNGISVKAVNQGNFIHVDRACCVNNQIFGRHCFGNVPSRECVSFGYIIRGSYNCCTVFICLDAVPFAVDRIGYRVGINAPNSSDGYICSRKNTVFGHSVPSVKGMTELFRIFRNSDSITFISRKREIRLTIDHEGYRILSIFNECRIKHDVLRRHGGGSIPARESEMVRNVICGSKDFFPVSINLYCVNLTIDIVSNGVFVHSQCRIKNKVLGRHGFRNVPTGEGVSLGHGVFGCGNCCSEFVGLSGVFLAVDCVGNRIAVGRVLSGNGHVFRNV